MSQIKFDFIEEEDQRNSVDKIDVYDVVNPMFGISYGEVHEGKLEKGRWILHSTGALDNLCPLAGRTFPYLLDEKNLVVKKASLQGSGAEYRTWNCANIQLPCHTLVASAFLINDNPKIKRMVDHKNQEKVDFRIKNLRWISYSQNRLFENITKGAMKIKEQKIINKKIK